MDNLHLKMAVFAYIYIYMLKHRDSFGKEKF